MGKTEVYRAVAIPISPDGVDSQIYGMNRRIFEQIYRGAARRTAGELDRDVGPIKGALHPDVQAAIDDRARELARTIPEGTNKRIKAALDAMPDGLSDAEMRAQLQPTLDGIHAYTHDSLLPGMANQTVDQARNAVYARNAIAMMGRVIRNSGSAIEDQCAEWAAQGEMPTAELSAITLPAHRNCQCTKEITSVDAATVPAVLDLGAAIA